jgi:hypothetical protein
MRFDLKPNQRRRTVLLALAAALVLASAACSPAATPAPLPALRPTNTPAATATPTPTRTPVPLPTLTPTPTATPPYPITTVAAGETLALGDLVLTVAPIAGAAPAAQPGRQLVLLDLAIQNVGEQLVSIDAARDLVLKDGANRFYKINPAAVAAIRGTTPDVDLTPGEAVRAQVGFDVPAEARDMVLSFAADRFKAGRIFVRLPAASQAALLPATETPTDVSTDTPTETPTALAVLTATVAPPAQETAPAPTPAAASLAVTLLEPNDGDLRSGSVTFRWSVTEGSLPAGQAYEVVIYQAGQDPLQDGYGLAAPVVATSVQVDLAGLDADPNFPLEPGPYLWGVRRVEQGTGRPLGMAAEGRRLIFQRASAPPPAPQQPTPPPVQPTPVPPQPTPTPQQPTPTPPQPTPTTPPAPTPIP